MGQRTDAKRYRMFLRLLAAGTGALVGAVISGVLWWAVDVNTTWLFTGSLLGALLFLILTDVEIIYQRARKSHKYGGARGGK